MLALISAWLAIHSAELAVLLHFRKADHYKDLVLYAKPMPTRLMIVDRLMLKAAGTSDWRSRLMAKAYVNVIRKLSSTKSFEYLILGLVNKDSFWMRAKRKEILV